MAPPCFGDLGKDARDLFSKGFHNGIVKLDVKTVTDNKVEFKLSGSHNQASSKADGKLEAKMKLRDFTVTETWDTKNTLGAKVEFERKCLAGLKLTTDSSFNTATGAKSGTFKINYKHNFVNLVAENQFDGLQIAPPVVNGSIVFGCPAEGHQGWLAGGQVEFDIAKKTLVKNQVILGYENDVLKLHSSVKNLNEFGGTIYHKVCPSTEVGVDMSWNGGNAATKFGLAAKHKLDKASHVNFAVDNKSMVKLGFTNTLRPGVKATFSVNVDGKAISGGDHKVGLGLDFDLS